jgi:alpha-1,6-mannosyltransferase
MVEKQTQKIQITAVAYCIVLLYFVLQAAQAPDIRPHAGFFVDTIIKLTLVHLIFFGAIKRAFELNPRPFLILATSMFLLLTAAPYTISTDASRYIWDGQQISQGVNPYDYSPDTSPSRDQKLFKTLEWRFEKTVYAPVAQAIFYVSALLYNIGGLGLAHTWLSLPYILVGLLLYRQKLFGAAAFWLFSPFVLLELGLSSHIDGWMILLLLMSLLALKSRKYTQHLVLLAATVLIKPWAALFVIASLVEVWRLAGVKKTLVASAIAGVFGLACIGYFANQDLNVVHNYAVWAKKYEFFSLTLLPLSRQTGITLLDLKTLASILSATLAVVVPIVSIVRAKFGKKSIPIEIQYLLLSVVYLLLSPVLYPWYGATALFLILYMTNGSLKPKLLFFYCALTLSLLSYVQQIQTLSTKTKLDYYASTRSAIWLVIVLYAFYTVIQLGRKKQSFLALKTL